MKLSVGFFSMPTAKYPLPQIFFATVSDGLASESAEHVDGILSIAN